MPRAISTMVDPQRYSHVERNEDLEQIFQLQTDNSLWPGKEGSPFNVRVQNAEIDNLPAAGPVCAIECIVYLYLQCTAARGKFVLGSLIDHPYLVLN